MFTERGQGINVDALGVTEYTFQYWDDIDLFMLVNERGKDK